MRLAILAALTAALLLPAVARARPAYAIREGRPCAYCHVNPAGGGPRNPRGLYYAQNRHSFARYDEVKVMGRFSPPLFHEAWREILPASVRRIAVGDTQGDGRARLVLLTAEGAVRRVSVRRWTGAAWTEEFAADAPGADDRLAVGRFDGGRRALIVTSTALWQWNGTSYEKRPSTRAVSLLGTVVLASGEERLLVRDGDAFRMHRVDPSRPGDWLGPGEAPPSAASTVFSEMKGRTEELTRVGLPDVLAAGGIVGLWDARKTNALFFYAVQLLGIVEEKGQPVRAPDPAAASQNLVLRGQEVRLGIVDPRSPVYKFLWRSDRLPGPVLDVALSDPRTGGRGLIVLVDGAADGRGRTLIFYQLD